eukprot:gnl/TRDRNA2_/TRDRNA2_36688_c0_seq1.p1 gnl/TRDRNA2_/TRDRNA2_36688_c0~~gnl/TRDRNA2_/TRDRNA2_36688_c0_seq1.p1  ORF type:complete len:313 (+),score=43.33 gnl/TRDRNA2_/TRDRNA2_36688_c0_seq1:140-1078(+)
MTVLGEVVHNDRKKDDPPEEEDNEEDLVFDQVPVRVTCPHCGLNVITYIEYESSWVTYAGSAVLMVTLGWAALCVVPVVYPLLKDVVHHCPRCLNVLATRSRLVLPSFRQEVMSFRFGSCVVVLARKYVLLLLGLSVLIGGIHFMRSSGPPGAMAAALASRGNSSSLSWNDFQKDCGFKSYLGNPIHVAAAFKQKYKDRTFSWRGSATRSEEGFSILGWSQPSLLFVRMPDPQFPNKPDWPDLVLTFEPSAKVGEKVMKLKKGAVLDFEATMIEVGKRGAPHVMTLWEMTKVSDPPGKNTTDKKAGDRPPPV